MTSDMWTREEQDGHGNVYRTNINGHRYLKIEEEYAKESFDMYLDLVRPDRFKTRFKRSGGDDDKEYEERDIGDLEKNSLRFVGNLIGSVEDTENGRILNVDTKGVVNYQELYWSIHDFIESGSGRDAFNIYYLFLHHVLGIGRYEDVNNIIEMLSNYESNAANLVMSHRDHYVHSVYVFLIGLAIYNSNASFRSLYRDYYIGYHKDETSDPFQIDIDDHFMKFWGVSSLFHDIGYVYEIPFEQIKSYGKSIEGSEDKIFFAYKQADFWDDLRKRSVKLSKDDVEKLCDHDNTGELSYSLDDIFTYHIKRRLGPNKERKVDWTHLTGILNSKATAPEIASSRDEHPVTDANKVFMDHAYFSAKILFDILIRNDAPGDKGIFGDKYLYDHMDALTAVLMHNSLFKFVIRNKQPLAANEHPLAYLLMLCDELQIWNRTSFGIDSKKEMHSMDIGMSFEGDTIKCKYRYDKDFENETERKKSLVKMYPDPEKTQEKKNVFLNDIEEIVRINKEDSGIRLELVVEEPEFGEDERFLQEGLSDGKLVFIYNLARNLWMETKRLKAEKSLYGYWDPSGDNDNFYTAGDFGELSVHIQNSYINRAKSLDRYLLKRGYFYTDRKLGMHRLSKDDNFSADDLKCFTECEAQRLKDELIRYGQGSNARTREKVKKYATIPLIESEEEIRNAINNIVGLSIYKIPGFRAEAD